MTIIRFEPGPRMSQAVTHGNTIYLAGMVGEKNADIARQTETALAEIARVLAATGSSRSKALQVTVWLADIADFAAMNAVYDAWIDPNSPPARACGEARLADPGYKVEFIVTAAKDAEGIFSTDD